ncbi:hypothetical protein SAMN04488128_103650 [Chitinophaga eiseniae]|uniref:Uncharacterized protein n=1 Tax=Chitinophaga eiseniae TaxID=634771 RepID=A0A1T4SVZ1_9BACT|nr:hypothetical protein [Chitinophaga eiseniae]SKA32363.1 hypothetical protein SAMN04488128_103650 [Chitinophaga eiseniae]
MTTWNYFLLVAGVIVAGWLIIQEVRRPKKGRLAARIVVTLVAVACLVVAGWPLYVSREEAPPRPAVKAATPAAGIVACDWPRRLSAGAEWQVQGRYRNNTTRPVILRLAGFDTTLDSLVIAPQQESSFSLSALPLHQGRAVYRITAMAGKDTLEQQPLPLEVMPVTPLTVLFLAQAPDFENRFLADWLVQQGNAVAMRTLVAKNKYLLRFSNFPQQSLDVLTPALLDKFDVVISQAGAIDRGTRARLEEAGIGLVLKADSAGTQPRPLQLKLRSGRRLPVLYTDPGQVLPSGNGQLPLVTDSLHRAYVTVSLAGAGKLVRSHLFNTYSWQLEGQPAAYGQYWSALLEAAARKKATVEKVTVHPAIARVYQPLDLQLETAAIPTLQAGGIRLSLAQHPWLPYRHSGTWWPQKTGWQQINTGTSVSWNYIFRDDDWKNLRAMHPSSVPTPLRQTSLLPLSPLWWLMPLFFTLIFLWWEKKM